MTRYELVERIGSGGMAEIFRGKAIAAGGFEKPVAIKRILPHLSQDKRFVELLIAEAHILSHLRHRNIVQIFDVGLGPDGQYFLVIEYVDGADLRCLQDGLEANETKVSLDLGLYIGAEVCDALEQAHTAPGPDGQPMRLVHRDVSPSNVLLSRSGEVKLTDFGIAKRSEEVTGHGTVRGKFAYISPEQAINAHVDARSDVFSVGIVLFELLLGRRLFSQMPDFDALRAVRAANVPRPSQLEPTIEPRLDRLLMKALAKNPDDRFTSAGELARELREVRYSMPASDADPVQELASLVARYARPEPLRDRVEEDPFEEATVVRINTSSGFSLNTDYDDDQHKSYVDARMILSSFEEEVTRAISYDPALASQHDPDFSDDVDDASRDLIEGEGEATVVGSVSAMRKRFNPEDERPTSLVSKVIIPSAMAGEMLFDPPREGTPAHAEWAGELGSHTSHDRPPQAVGESGGGPLEGPLERSINGLIDGSIDGPTLDREFGDDAERPLDIPSLASHSSLGVPAGSIGAADPMHTATAAVSLYSADYEQYAMEQAARRRRKQMLVGVGIGAALLLMLLVVGLLGDSGEAASDAVEMTTDAAPVDAGTDAMTDAASVEPDATVQPTKKPRKKRPRKKRTTKKTTTKKTTTKKTTTRKRKSSTN